MAAAKLRYSSPASAGAVPKALVTSARLTRLVDGAAQQRRLKLDDALGKMRSAGNK